MDYEVNQNIPFMDEIKTQAQVLLPVLKAARAELGEERANRLILGALRTWVQEAVKQLGARLPGRPKEKYNALMAMTTSTSRIQENDLAIESLREEPEVQEFNVTRCRYAEFFRQLGEPELGYVLCCEADIYVAEVGSPEVEFARTQTIMRGASFCDFRFRIKSQATPK
jgi:hypothetical protein